MDKHLIQFANVEGEGPMGPWAHIDRYLTREGFEWKCRVCGKTGGVKMPARNLAAAIKEFASTHAHGVA